MQIHELEHLRTQFPALARMTYLDSAGAGLPSTRVSDVMRRVTLDWASTGEHWEQWLLEVVKARKVFAGLVGGETDEVGVVPSVSVGLAALASSLKLRNKKKVVTSSLNFPTNVVLWQRMKESGLLKRVTVLRGKGGMVPFNDWVKAIDDETAAVAVDYVSWFSGARENIREIAREAHKHGAVIVVDAFHALSVVPLDVKKDDIDMLACGFYKWLCGPHGVACVYIRKDLLTEFAPSYIGWHGVDDNVVERVLQSRDPFDNPFPLDRAKPSKTAARFEWGTWSPMLVTGAIESMNIAMQMGLEGRFRAVSQRVQQLREGLEELGLGSSILTPSRDINPGSGIVNFGVKDHTSFVSELRKRKLIVSGRFGHVRVSPHFYNTSEEIELFLSTARKLLKN
jgi:cysteine desulfurase/selenocysteine lyase